MSAQMTERSMNRQARHKRRIREGKAVFPLVLDRVAVEEALIRSGWLHPADRDSLQEVLAAWEAAHVQIVIQDQGYPSPHGSSGRHTILGDDEEN